MRIIIKKDQDGEYRVPAPNGGESGAYYTDDKEDAVVTARIIYKHSGYPDIKIDHRNVSEH